MGVETTIREIADELEKIATTKTVVGEPITAAGKTIVPISRITMGFGPEVEKVRRILNLGMEEVGVQE